MLFIFGLISASISALIVRAISSGKEILATIFVTIGAYIQMSAVMSINIDNLPLYLTGIAIGTYLTIRWDKKRGG